MLTPYTHQQQTAEKWVAKKNLFDFSDPGTGKTGSAITGYMLSPARERMLVIAPLSILRPSWGDDINKFSDTLTYTVAHGTPAKRTKAFEADSDIVITNHDGVNWIVKNPQYLAGFSHLVVDEFTAFKNRSTQRSSNLGKIAKHFEYIIMLSGTPNSNLITDIWWPAAILDNGLRLGTNFYRFQNMVAEPLQVAANPKAKKWLEKDGAREYVADQLRDISIRHLLEECTDIPEHSKHTIYVDLPADVMAQYNELKRRAYLELEEGAIKAIHAGSLAKKLLQLLTGAIYNEDGEVIDCHPHRYELVMDLVQQREQCVVGFNWRHERVALCKLAEKLKIPYGVIDGSVNLADRERYVADFQAGILKVIFCHPQSAGHGLTLTAGTSTIWASPTYNAEHFVQLNRRIYRNGQKKKTETLMIAARGTKEAEAYEILDGKMERMEDLLYLLAELSKTNSINEVRATS